MQLTSPLTFVHDPGHGWLRVPVADVVALGITDNITPYSYCFGGFVYLEEDLDAGAYLQAVSDANLPKPEIEYEYTPNFDRSRPSFSAEIAKNLEV